MDKNLGKPYQRSAAMKNLQQLHSQMHQTQSDNATLDQQIFQKYLSFLSLPKIQMYCSQEIEALNKYISQINPTLQNIDSLSSVQGVGGQIRRWLAQHKNDYFKEKSLKSGSEVQIEDILTLLGTNQVEQAVLKLFSMIQSFDQYFLKLLQIQSMNILKFDQDYSYLEEQSQKGKQLPHVQPQNQPGWRNNSLSDLVVLNFQREASFVESYIKGLKETGKLEIGLQTESEKLTGKINELLKQNKQQVEQIQSMRNQMILNEEVVQSSSQLHLYYQKLLDQTKSMYNQFHETLLKDIYIQKTQINDQQLKIEQLNQKLASQEAMVEQLRMQADQKVIRDKADFQKNSEIKNSYEQALVIELQFLRTSWEQKIEQMEDNFRQMALEKSSQINYLTTEVQKLQTERNVLLNKLALNEKYLASSK